jgi:hypothetical protein
MLSEQLARAVVQLHTGQVFNCKKTTYAPDVGCTAARTLDPARIGRRSIERRSKVDGEFNREGLGMVDWSASNGMFTKVTVTVDQDWKSDQRARGVRRGSSP